MKKEKERAISTVHSTRSRHRINQTQPIKLVKFNSNKPSNLIDLCPIAICVIRMLSRNIIF